jgi:hypothetical protein
MAIRNLSTDALKSTLSLVPYFGAGPDTYVKVSAEEVDALKSFIRDEYSESAAALLEPVEALEDLLDAATYGLPEDIDVDISELLGFYRKNGAVDRVTPCRICAAKDGGAEFIAGSLRVPVTQEGADFRIGRLKATGDSGFEKGERQTQNGPIYFPSHRFIDQESKDVFRVDLFATKGIDMEALSVALMNGEPLDTVLAQMGSGAGGAVKLKDYLNEDKVPFAAQILGINRYPSDSQWAKNGHSYSAKLRTENDGDVTVWLRGQAEDFIADGFEVVERKLQAGKEFLFKALTYSSYGEGKVSIQTQVQDKSADSYFAALEAARQMSPAKTAEALPEAKATTKAQPKEAVAEEATPERATRASAFAKAKAKSAAAA